MKSGWRGGRCHWIFYSFLGDDFSKLRNYYIVSDGDNTQVQLETIPPFPHQVRRDKDYIYSEGFF